jgi:hypothetical protein
MRLRNYRRSKYRRPYRVKKKESIYKNRFFWLVLLGLIIITGIFNLIFFLPQLQIKDIEIFGNQSVAADDIQNFLQDKIEHRFVFFNQKEIVSKSIFLASGSLIKEALLDEFPKIEKADIKKEYPQKLSIGISERKAVAILCQDDEEDGNFCFLIDKKGISFEKTTGIENSNLVKILEKRESASRQTAERGKMGLGRRIIEEEYLNSILEIKEKLLNSLQIETNNFIIYPEKLVAKTSKGWEVYFDLEKDISWQLTKLELVFSEKKISSEKMEDLKYIELRFGDRVFPGFKENNQGI